MIQPPDTLPLSTVVGIGCAYLTDGSLTRYDDRLIRAALEAGACHFDVAPSYGLGTAERVLGRALGGDRNRVSIVTKVGIRRPQVRSATLVLRSLLAPLRKRLQGSTLSTVAIRATAQSRVLDYSADFLQSSLEQSLRELSTGYVDACLLHMPTPADMTDDVVSVLERMKANGKARYIGLATTMEDTAPILLRYPGVFDVVQHAWSVLDAPLAPNPEGTAPRRITHRALLRALTPMTEWLATDATRSLSLSQACNADIADPAVLTRALLGAAVVANAGGTILVASRSIERTRSNVATCLDPATRDLGRVFVRALQDHADLPNPQE